MVERKKAVREPVGHAGSLAVKCQLKRKGRIVLLSTLNPQHSTSPITNLR